MTGFEVVMFFTGFFVGAAFVEFLWIATGRGLK